MKNLRFSALLSGFYSIEEMYNWMRLPTHYVAYSIDDFESSKKSLRHSPVQILFPDPVAKNYSIIYLHDVKIDMEMEDDREIIAINEYDEKSRKVIISDETGESRGFWPDRPHSKLGFNDANLVQKFNFGDIVYRLTMLYDLNYHNSFIYDIQKHKNSSSSKSRMTIEDVVREYIFDIRPNYS